MLIRVGLETLEWKSIFDTLPSFVVQLIICLVVHHRFWVWFESQANRSRTTRNCALDGTASARSHLCPVKLNLTPVRSDGRKHFCSNEPFFWFLLGPCQCCLVSVEWTQPSEVAWVNGFSVHGDRDTVGSDRCLISSASLSCLCVTEQSRLWSERIWLLRWEGVVQLRRFYLDMFCVSPNLLIDFGWTACLFLLYYCQDFCIISFSCCSS